ncbi:MAG TPA: Calx-beta domain-containing protein, partial [Pyrinomonadaceae bacterium]|nr:Calx-beta domain-containing protein [Pyrinomonadaceae bacterium]
MIEKVARAAQFRFVTRMVPFANLLDGEEEVDFSGYTDLSLTKVVSAEQAVAGANVTYTIQVNNSGANIAANVELNDPLPQGLTFVSLASPAGWTCDTPAAGDGGTITCLNPSLAASASATFSLVVKLPSSVESGTFFTNIATVTSTTPDFSDENNSASATTGVAGTSADLGISKSVNAEQALPGAQLTYTITVTSGAAAENAEINDTLPGTLTFVSLSSPDGWTCTTPAVGAGGTINCKNPNLPVTSGDVFTLVAEIPSGEPAGTSFSNTATISSSTADPNDENNSATTSTEVGTGAHLVGTKSVGGSNTPGSIVSYTVVLTNTGTLTQRDNPGDEFADALPAQLTLISAEASVGFASADPASNTVTWNGGIGGFGSSVTISITARIRTGTAGQIVTNQGLVRFDADDNGTNEASALTDDPSVGGASDPTSFVVACAPGVVVTSINDNGQGSLRQAISDACPGGTISFDPAVFNPAGGPYTITLTSAELLLNKNLTINGPGAKTLTVKRDSGAATDFRIFNVTATGVVNISGLTISGGKASGTTSIDEQGGAILNQSSATVNVTDSTLSGNYAEEGGGGIYNKSNGTITVINSVLNGNATNGGGAIYNLGSGSVNVTNSTISGNSSNGFGSGIFNQSTGTVTVTNATISGNSAAQGGGIRNQSTGLMQIKNSIIALNTAATDPDLQGTITSQGYNIVGSTGSATITPQPGDQFGVTAAQLRLGPLANNGGPTQTHALLPGSTALDAGNNAFVTNPPFSGPPFTDQRSTGFSRIVDSADADATATVDIGAFEAQVSVQDITDKATNEDTPLSFTFNVGEAGQITSVTATSGNSTLVPNNPANLNVSGSGSTRTLDITPALNQTGTTTITINVTGSNSQVMSDTFVLTVNPINDGPVNTVPGAQSVLENGTLTFSSANSNPISIADPDSGANPVQVTLTATNGSITLSGTSGLSFTVGDGTADAQMTFTGTIANINAALNGLVFAPPPAYDGAASIQIVTNDQGNTGSGGALSDTDTVNITVLGGGTLAFSSATYTVAEDGGSVIITVNRAGASNGEARVNYATSNGTATAGSDYAAASGQLVFADGETSKTFTVTVNNDTTDEADETIDLTLSGISGSSSSLGEPSTAVLTIIDNDPPVFQFNSPTYSVNEDALYVTVTVSRTGDASAPVSVNYETNDQAGLNPCNLFNGIASPRCDYAYSVGKLNFAAGQASRDIIIPIVNDVYVEGPETFTITLSHPTGGEVGVPGSTTITINDDDHGGAANPIDSNEFFIRQLYIDFLGRLPDQAGLAAWLNILNNCPAGNTSCDRIAVALGFAQSDEFATRGYFIYRTYRASLGRIPHYTEFVPDMARVSGFLNAQELEAAKADVINNFMAQPEFTGRYGGTDDATYVNLLEQTAQVTLPNKQQLIDDLANHTKTRAEVLRIVIDTGEVQAKYSSEAFIVMNYFGFLRRDPDAAYQGWIDLFNSTHDYRAVVSGFINSSE